MPDTRLEAVLAKLDPTFREKRTKEQLYGNINLQTGQGFVGAASLLLGTDFDVRRSEAKLTLYEAELGPEPSESATDDERELYRQQKHRVALQRDSVAEMHRNREVWLQEVEELQRELAEMALAAAQKAPAVNGAQEA